MATETVETETQFTEASTDTAVITPITMSFNIMAMRSPRRGGVLNRPFPSSPPPPFQSEAKCEVFVMKISFHSY